MSLSPSTSTLPLIAIVGRPNVGKSTLFNRLGRSRRALVADTPGLTRDRIVEEVEIAGRRVLLVDTAGLEPKASENLSAAIQAQALSAVEEADGILFVVDGQSGLLPEDASIAKTLRRSDKPLVLAVNKIDVPAHTSRVAEFHQLGFERVVAVSAEHGTGAFDSLEQLVEALPDAEFEPEPAREGEIRITLAGRPNVGKSSLMNRLIGAERVVVSDIPGTTRDSIDLRLEHDGLPYVLVDTAGLRRPGKRTQRIERGTALMTVRSIQRAQVALLLIDGSEGLTDQDAHVARMLRDRGCAAIVLANKWDLVDGERAGEVLEGIRHGLRFMSDAPILTISALSGLHLGKLFGLVRQVFEAGERQVSTAKLNRWLGETVERQPPPMDKHGRRRRPIKFFYVTQVGVHPPSFVFFCTEPRAVLASYKRFLENQLRARFDFAGTPVKLRFRARTEAGGSSPKRGRGGR